MKLFNRYSIKLIGKIADMLDEIAIITGQEREQVIEKLVIDYYKEIISKTKNSGTEKKETINLTAINLNNAAGYANLKIGKIANIHLRNLLENSVISDQLLTSLQRAEYSKINFDLQYPLLVKKGTVFESVRYYKSPLLINGEEYYMCSQWFETTTNDDRSFLLDWMDKFKTKGDTRL